MNNVVLIIISGAPGTGKTTLGKKFAEKFHLPLIHKDGIKESLFDSLGVGDREWSRKLGISSYRLLFHFLESLLGAGVSLIVESNFKPESSQRFRELEKKYCFKSLQIYCHSRDDVLLQRYRMRSESADRHLGHLDNIVSYELEDDLLKGIYKPLDIEGDIVYVDTTDFSKVDYESLYFKIQGIIENRLEE